MKNLLIGIVVLAIAGGFAYISMNAPSVEPTPSPTLQATPTPMTENVMEINLEAGSFYYAPDTITVKKGQPVKIIMTSVDAMHDFIIDELDVKMPVVQNGDTGEVEFTPDTIGEFEYYCSVGEHRANGQVGKLIVTE